METSKMNKLILARRFLVESIAGILVYISMLQVVLAAIEAVAGKSPVEVKLTDIALMQGPVADLKSDKADNACRATMVSFFTCIVIPTILYSKWSYDFMKDDSIAVKTDVTFIFYLIEKRSVKKIRDLRAFCISVSLGALVFAIFNSGEAVKIFQEIYTSIILICVSIQGILKPWVKLPTWDTYKAAALTHGVAGKEMVDQMEGTPPFFEIEKLAVFPFYNVKINLTTGINQIRGATINLTFDSIAATAKTSGTAKV